MSKKGHQFRPDVLRLIMIFFAMIIICSTDVTANNNTLNEIYVTTEEELRAAFRNRNAIIVVNTTIQLTEEAIEVNGNITLQGDGVIEATGRFEHFIVNEGAEFTLAGDLTLLSVASSRFGGITVHGTLNMHGGVIRDSANSGVNVSYGTFNMYGGKIIYNENLSSSQPRGGGVNLRRATFNMYDGLIANNIGSGVSARINSMINIYGGVISDNEGYRSGIDLVNSFLVIYDGEIRGSSLTNSNTITLMIESHAAIHGGVIDGGILKYAFNTLSATAGEIDHIFIDHNFDHYFNDSVALGSNVVIHSIQEYEGAQPPWSAPPRWRASHRWSISLFQPYIYVGVVVVILIFKLVRTIIFFRTWKRIKQYRLEKLKEDGVICCE